MSDPRDAFVIHRLRAKPIEYNVGIKHFVANGDWVMGVTVNDVAMETPDERARVAEDLRAAAVLIERDVSRNVSPEPQWDRTTWPPKSD
jgi:hypothetical protein